MFFSVKACTDLQLVSIMKAWYYRKAWLYGTRREVPREVWTLCLWYVFVCVCGCRLYVCLKTKCFSRHARWSCIWLFASIADTFVLVRFELNKPMMEPVALLDHKRTLDQLLSTSRGYMWYLQQVSTIGSAVLPHRKSVQFPGYTINFIQCGQYPLCNCLTM